MAIPDYQTLMLPLLKCCSDGEVHTFSELVPALSDEFRLTEEERSRLLPSGRSKVMRNRIGWAKTYLAQAGLLESTKRGSFRITARGTEVLSQTPDLIDVPFLDRFEGFQEFRSRRRQRAEKPSESIASDSAAQTPEEALEEAHQQLTDDLESEVLAQVLAGTPEFFEKLVVTLLLRMGYGGSREDAGQAVGRSGDGGIDGIIKEDRLGLDAVYLQAKRWENTVGRPEIQRFAGALQGQRARKGVFLTTSSFSKDAIEYANTVESSIVLIDGHRLATLMIEHNVGVTVAGVFEIKKIDSDFFADE